MKASQQVVLLLWLCCCSLPFLSVVVAAVNNLPQSFVVDDAAAVDPIAQSVLAAMDWTTDPCQDFYQFSCGTWLNQTILPPDQGRYDRSFNTIMDNNYAIMKSILENGTNTKLSTFYNSCMNVSAIEEEGPYPLFPWYEFTDDVQDIGSFMFVLGTLHAHGVSSPLFSFSVVIDAKNPTINIADFGQGGLALPYPGLYQDNTIVPLYLQHMTNMFSLAGEEMTDAMSHAQEALEMETAIANFTLPNDALVDPFFTYNKLNISGLKELAPDIDWDSYLEGLGTDFEQLNVEVPWFFGNLTQVMTHLADYWGSYLRWHVVHHFAPRLNKAFRDENFNFFGKILGGRKEQSPRWKTCIGATDGALGELLGKYFLAEAFPGESQDLAVKILHSIEAAMKVDIIDLNWMDNTTRGRALDKLSLISNMIGGPTSPQNYSKVFVEPNSYFSNALFADLVAMQKLIQTIGTPSDITEWGMTSPTVNAYYDPTRNQMVFPAGILQQPFFNVSFPYAMNAGGIGMVMGHELTHGFDNQGRDFDGHGKLTNWWLESTSKQFNTKVQCVIDQYSKFEPIPGVFVNGKLTQGENIADLGGIKNSFNAYLTTVGNEANQPSIVPNLSNSQLFFVAFAQGWCEKATDEYIRVQVETNPHSPAKYRVLGPLIDLPQFSDTFKCSSGSPMNPSTRCIVW